MNPDFHEEIESLRREIYAQSIRIANLEGQFQTTLLSVLKGLKGSDDGSGDGLYERVRAINQMQLTLLSRLASVEQTLAAQSKVVTESETEKKTIKTGRSEVWAILATLAAIAAAIIALVK